MLRWLMSILTLGALVLSSHTADACICSMPKTLCEALSYTNTVFVGTVRNVVGAGIDLDVTVDVEESFAGSPGKTVTIAARGLGGSCDFGDYKVGEKMLIFGGMRGGPMHVSGCSRTAPVSRAAADIAELRRLVKRGMATLSGTVSVQSGTPRSDIPVRLAGTTWATRTDDKGRYRFELPVGRYTVEIPADPRIVSRKEIPIDLVPGACMSHDIDESWNGRIQGTVRDRKGKPIAGVLVQGHRTSWTPPPAAWHGPNPWSPSARTDTRGAYDIGPLPPDTYRVAVGVPFSPSEPYPPSTAPDVKLGPGAVVGGVDLVVAPMLATHTITARVMLTGPGGPRDVEVVATERASGREYQRYGPPGNVTFTDAAGGTLELRACIGHVGCTVRTVKVDRDRVVDLPVETHTVTLRAVAADAGTRWDWWRVWYDSNYPHAYLVGSPHDAPVTILGIAGNPVEVRACVLDAVTRQTDLGCATTTVSFDRDLTIDLAIPITP